MMQATMELEARMFTLKIGSLSLPGMLEVGTTGPVTLLRNAANEEVIVYDTNSPIARSLQMITRTPQANINIIAASPTLAEKILAEERRQNAELADA